VAHEPENLLQTMDQFGPHLAYNEAPSQDAIDVPDRLVDTHCCFCGQQCGITLKVKDNRVIGFEPRYDFPFNEGMLCPKGVKLSLIHISEPTRPY